MWLAAPPLTFHVLRRSCGVLLVSRHGTAVAALRLGGVSCAVPHGFHLGLAVLLRGAALPVSFGRRCGRRGEGREQRDGAATRRGRLHGSVSGGGVRGARIGLGVKKRRTVRLFRWVNRQSRDDFISWEEVCGQETPCHRLPV